MAGVAKFVQPDFTSQGGTAYKTAIDGSISVMARVSAAFACHEQTPQAMAVTVDAGAVFFNNAIVEKTAQNITITAAPTGGDNRIDRIVLDSTTGVAQVVTGTPANTPVAPAIPSNFQPIARIYIASDQTAVTNADITDERISGAKTGSPVVGNHFTGDGVTLAYTLTGVNSTNANGVIWEEGGRIQVPDVDYSVSGNVLTRTSPPALGVPVSWRAIGDTQNYALGVPGAGTVGLTSLMAEVMSMFVPVGACIPYGGDTDPAETDRFIIADGRELSRADYPDLFARVGTRFGEGDGSTTFNILKPDGMFMRFTDNGAGKDPDAASRTAMATGGATGDNVGSVQNDAIRSHSHQLQQYISTKLGGAGSLNITSSQTANGGYNSGVTGGNETRPVNFNMNLLIRVK